MSEVAMAVFFILDLDDSGTLSPSEVRSGVKRAFPETAPPPSKVDNFFRVADVDGSGFIDPNEFTTLVTSLCSYMRISATAFHSAVTRSEFDRMFETLSIDQQMTRSETEALLTELCTALNSPLTAGRLMSALDRLNNKTPGDVVTSKTSSISRADFMMLLTELTQSRPSPALNRIFRAWEANRREDVKDSKQVGFTGEGTAVAAREGKCSKGGVGSSSRGPSSKASSSKASSSEVAAQSCQKCPRLEGSLRRLKSDVEVLQGELLNATQTLTDQRETQAAQAAEEAKWSLEVQEQRDRVGSLQRELRRGEKKLKEIEDLNRTLSNVNSESTTELDQTSAVIRNLEERLRMSQQEAAEVKNEMNHVKDLNTLFSDLEAKVNGLVTTVVHDINQVRSDALDAQAQAFREEKQRFQQRELDLSSKELDMERREATAKKVQEHLADRTTRLAGRELSFEKQQQLAERTSLPEREDRMTRIADLERVLCQREAMVQERLDEIETKESIIRSASTIVADYERVKRELRDCRAALAVQIDSIQPSMSL